MKIFNTILFFILITTFGCRYHILSEEELKTRNERNKKVEAGISNWIKKFAQYPESYQSISFSEYSESSTVNKEGVVPNSEFYEVKHSHKILNKDSIKSDFTGYFILDYKFNVTSIEVNKNNSSESFLNYNVWTSKFGRVYNKEDSLAFDNYSKNETKKVFRDLKKGLDDGNLYDIGNENPTQINYLIDSINNLK